MERYTVKVIDCTPAYYVEKKWLSNILGHLRDLEEVAVIRDEHSKASISPDQTYISIITSTEKHDYIPPEIEDSKCLGVFMNYAPIVGDSYQVDNFFKHPKIHNLPLGHHKEFIRTPHNKLPFIEERETDIFFWGQFDPYRRQDFLNACNKIYSRPKTNLRMYNGWGNGWSQKEYSECLLGSKIALVPWGSASRNTFRFWEAYYSGCTIICNAQYKTWYSDKINFFTCKDDWSDLEYWVDHIMKNMHWIDLNNSTEKMFTEKDIAEYIRKVICQ